MAEKCPTSGYACVNRLLARAIAVADQAEAVGIVIAERGQDVPAEVATVQFKRFADLLRAALSDYTTSHGVPNWGEELEGLSWLGERLFG